MSNNKLAWIALAVSVVLQVAGLLEPSITISFAPVFVLVMKKA